MLCLKSEMRKTGKYLLRISLWIFLSLFFLILGGGIFVWLNAESYVNKNLSKFVDEKSGGLYQLSFDKIELELKPVSITISVISLEHNKQISNEILKKEPGKIFYSFHSPEVKLTDIDLYELLVKRKFHCKNISIVRPGFEFSGKGVFKANSTNYADKLFVELRPLFKKTIKDVLIDEISFIDANYKLYQSVSDATQISNAQEISIVIKKFTTDSAMIFSDLRFFDSDDIIVKMNRFRKNLADSLHVLTIDTLEYSLKTTDIFASGFHLFHIENNTEKNLYDVTVPRLHIKSRNLADFSMKDTLAVQHLNFENPKIRFIQKKEKKKIGIEEISQFSLYSLIENQFAEIKIDTFILTNADLKIFQQPDTVNFQQHFESLNMALDGFELNAASAQNRDKLFHADDLEMFAKGYKLRLIDNQHEFSADSMFVSTLSNSLGVSGIHIFPSFLPNTKKRTSVNVDCEALKIDNVNLKTLFHTRKLPTRHISVTRPKVVLKYDSDIARTNKKKEAGLFFELVTAYLKGVYSEVVEVEDGSLKIETFSSSVLQSYFESGFNFNLSGFALDSASIEQTDKFFYAVNFDLEFSDYQMKLADKLHKISAEQVSILSFDRKLEIKNLRLEPVIAKADLKTMQHFNRSELYNIAIPQITLWGINLRDAFFYNKLNIAKFQVSQPKIYFENFGVLHQKKEKEEFAELYQLVFNYLYDFDIKDFSIYNGVFTWVNHTKKGKTTSFDNAFSARLQNFRLNEKELKKQRLLFSDNFEISVKDQIFQLSDSVHILRAGEIYLSSSNKSVTIKNALLYPVITSAKYHDLPVTFQVTIPELQVSNFDYAKAYYSKTLQLNMLELVKPKFEIYSQAGAEKSLNLNKFKLPMPAFIKTLQLNELRIKNGEVINYEIDGLKHRAQSNFKINLSLPGVSLKNNIEKKAQLTTGNLIANIYDFRMPLGKRHELKIGTLDFDRENKTVSISQLKVNPFTQKRSDNRFTILAPQISFSGFDIKNALDNNFFEFDEIDIIAPKIAIEINDSVKGDKLEFAQNLDLYPYVEPFVDKIKVRRLQLQNIDLNFNWFSKKLIDKKFNLTFNEINIAENGGNPNLLNSNEFELSTTGLSTQSKDGFYEFRADSLIYNSAKHNTRLTGIEIIPLLSPEKFYRQTEFQTDYIRLKTDFAELKGVDENRWLKENILVADALVIGKTNLDIFRDKRLPFNQKQRPPWPQDLLKNIKQPFEFNSVSLSPSTLKYSELLDLSDERGTIGFYNLTLRTGKLSNIPEVIAQNPDLNINASAKLYNLGLLSVRVNLDLLANNYKHSLAGNLSPMPLTPFNQIIGRSVPVKIESGQLNRFAFNLQLTDKIATGTLFLGYDNFKISVLETKQDGTKRSKFASFWANKMVLNTKNPKGDKLLPTTIYYERNIQRSILNYWWKALFTGSKETIGLKVEKQK